MSRSLQLTGFQAYKLRVTHLYQLKQHNILASVGEDEQGINPLVSPGKIMGKTQTSGNVCWRLISIHPSEVCQQVKIWNLEKRDGGNPLCTRIFPAIPGTEPTVVSCLTVHENLNFMAIGKQKEGKAKVPGFFVNVFQSCFCSLYCFHQTTLF